MAEDDDRPLTVALQSIIITNSFNGSVTLSNARILIPIDSSVTDLWLPKAICDQIESAFGLQYHDLTGRYILSEATRGRLRQLSPMITFTIGTQMVEGQTTSIQIPFSALDLQASYPIFANTTPYFPIRRADNDSQYVIGRAFLQEVYLGVDYERKLFNISQAVFGTPLPSPRIIAIAPLNGTTNQTTQSRPSAAHTNRLSAGAIAGIVIGGVIAIVLVIVMIWFICNRPRRKSKTDRTALMEAPPPEVDLLQVHPQEPEILGAEIRELHGSHGLTEVEVREKKDVIVEMEGTPALYELR
jgi:hypothetical protein